VELLKEYTILVDSREQHPLQFPEWLSVAHTHQKKSVSVHLAVQRHRLDTGDYLLKEAPLIGVVERKCGLPELHNNLITGDRPRFEACLRRLAEFPRPVLVLEGAMSLYGVKNANNLCPDPPLVLSTLNRVCSLYGIPVLFASDNRRMVGEWVARYLIDMAVAYNYPDPSENPCQDSSAPPQ